MYCNSCGALMGAHDTVCRTCGQGTVGVAGSTSRAPGGRLRAHLGTLSILWFVFSAFLLIGAAVTFTISHFMRLHLEVSAPPVGEVIAPMVLFGVSMLCLALGAASFATGWGLYNRRDWGRPVALVMGFLFLLKPPFGTALGIYTLWVLMSNDADHQYRALAAAA